MIVDTAHPPVARWSDDRIKEFWTTQAQSHGAAPEASWSDVPVLDMEIREITSYLRDGEKILDVGCANGFSTLRFAQAKAINITGVDYIPEMITAANVALQQTSGWRGTVHFDVGDATALQFADNTFDKLVVIRVIINLGEWQRQLRGLQECIRVLKPGGTLILSEATVQGWERLNKLRVEWNLDPIPMPSFNNYLDHDKVREALADRCALTEINNFASSYYVGSRVIKPLLARMAGRDELVADPLCEFNRWISLLPAAGDYGTQKMMLFRKHG